MQTVDVKRLAKIPAQGEIVLFDVRVPLPGNQCLESKSCSV